MLQPIVRSLEDWTCKTERTDYEDFVSRDLVVPPGRSQNFCQSFSRAVHTDVLIRSSMLEYTDLEQHVQPGKTTYKNFFPHQHLLAKLKGYGIGGNLLNWLTHFIIRCKCFFLFIGRELTTWPANNCLQIMVCSCENVVQLFLAANTILLMREWNHAFPLLAIAFAWKWQIASLPEDIP